MPALRVHVRPPHKHTGLMILCAFYGTTCGACFFLAIEYVLVPLCEAFAPGFPGVFASWAEPAVVFTALSLPPVLCALYFARACQHYKYAYFGGQIMGCCYAAAMVAMIWLHEGSSFAGTPWWAFLVIIGLDLGAGAVTGLLNLLLTAVYYNCASMLVAQDGTLCSACGYCVAHSSSAHCSECGVAKSTPTKPLGRIYRMSELIGAQSRRLIYGSIICIMLASTGFVWRQMPVWRFVFRFKTEDGVVQQSFHNPAGGAAEFNLHAVELGTPIEGDPQSRAIIVQQYRRSYFDAPLLQVRIGYVVSMSSGGNSTFRYFMDGVPRIVCELDERQTEHAIDNGVPDTLAKALIDAADDAGWVPSGVAATGKSDVVVSADGHFPELEGGEK